MNREQMNRLPLREFDDGVPPPPRLLLIATVGVFVLFVLAVIIGIIILQVRPSMSELLQWGIIAAPILTIGSILLAVALRRVLPRHSAIILTSFWVLVWIGGGLVFILMFRSNLAPGQRETVKRYLPFMEVFAPPLPPADTVLPTPMAVQEGSISVDDLLSGSFGAPATATLGQPAAVDAAATPTLMPSQTPTLAATATVAPSMTPVIQPTLPPTAVSIAPTPQPVSNSGVPRPPNKLLGGIKHVKQGWNNCGPANITMALSYYGWTRDQEFAVSFLKPDREDKNVNPWELVEFVEVNTDLKALTRIGGNMEVLKQLIGNGFPVVIETGYMFEGSDWLGHYQTVVGYDDTLQSFFVYDSYLGSGENGSGMPKPYKDFDAFWQNFNRTFIVIYQPQDENTITTILGDLMDTQQAAEIALQTAQSEARANPNDAFAWFNIGTAYTELGQYAEAAAAYDRARVAGLHWRMTMYQFGPFTAYFQQGRYEDILTLVNSSMNSGGQYIEELHFWQGKVYQAEGDFSKARASFRQALVHHPGYTDAQAALASLPS